MKINVLKLVCLFLTALIVSCSPEDGVDGIDGKDGLNGSNGVDGANGVSPEINGTPIFVLSGDITDEEAANRIEENVGFNTQIIYVKNTTQLTTVNFAGIESALTIEVENNTALTSINFPDLVDSFESFAIIDNTGLIDIQMPNLINVSGLYLRNNSLLPQLDLPKLKDVSEYLEINNNKALATIITPSLITSSRLAFNNNEVLSSIEFPQLIMSSDLFVSNNTSLKSIQLDELKVLGALNIYENEQLETINFPNYISNNFVSDNSYRPFGISNNSSLKSIIFPNLEDLSAESFFNINDNKSLEIIEFPKLTRVARDISLYSNSELQSINFSSITEFENITIFESKLTTVSIEALLERLVAITPAISDKNISLSINPLYGGISTEAQEYITVLEENNNIFITN